MIADPLMDAEDEEEEYMLEAEHECEELADIYAFGGDEGEPTEAKMDARLRCDQL